MNRKIFVGVFSVIVLLLAFVWQLAAGGVTISPGLNETGEGSDILAAEETLYTRMPPAVVIDIDGTIGAGWDTYAYKRTITMRKIGTAETMSADIWLMNDAQFLYIAFKWHDTTQHASDWVGFYFDEEHDHQILAPSDTGWHAYAGSEESDVFSEDVKGAWGDGRFRDWYYPAPTAFARDDMNPVGTVDGTSAWTWSSDYWSGEWRIPLNSQDRFDINVKSGEILGLYIKYIDRPSEDNWAYGAPPQTGADEDTNPSAWEDLLTTKVFSASIPHVHDDVVNWRAWIGVQNTGTRESTVVFRFSDGYFPVSRTLAPGEHMGEYAKDLHWGDNFVGSILVYSDQPFTASLGQRDAARDIMGWSISVGEN